MTLRAICRIQFAGGFVGQQQLGRARQRAAIATRCCWPPDNSAG